MALIRIAAPRHCDYIVDWLTAIFSSTGISTIRYKNPADMVDYATGTAHNLIISPQIYDKLPNRYSVFQVEQLTSDRWLNEAYINALRQSEYILDYSVYNLNILRNLGLEEQRLYYCPIGMKKKDIETTGWEERDISFLFYGDPSSPRRAKILNKLSEHIPITICSEVFGEELELHLKRSKYVLNIHFYEKALLETTRICQSLSLGANVISEHSLNDDEFHGIYSNGLITIDLEKKSTHKILQQLLDDPLILRTDKSNHESSSSASGNIHNCHWKDTKQVYHVARFLLEANLINYESFKQLSLESIDSNKLKKGIVLTLPESSRYTEAKKLATRLDLALFHGVKYNPGWRGCGLSYKLIGEACKAFDISTFTCLEDDCKIESDSHGNLQRLHSTAKTQNEIDLTSGIISDISNGSIVKLAEFNQESGSLVVQTNRVTSTLYNIYESKCLDLLAKWPLNSGLGSMLTIDRWLEIHNLVCITTYPYLADQASHLASSISGNPNSMQCTMIKRSEERIAEMTLDSVLSKLKDEKYTPGLKLDNGDKDAIFILERLRELFSNYSHYKRSEERLPYSTGSRLNTPHVVTADQVYDPTNISRTRTWKAITRLKQMTPGFFFLRNFAKRVSKKWLR